MKNYSVFLKWALISMIDRSTQDDKKTKINIEGLFCSPSQIEDNYIIRNPHIKRYIVNVDDLEEFETFYNFIQDIIKKYGADNAVYHVNDVFFQHSEQFRHILKLYNNVDFIRFSEECNKWKI